MQLKHTALFPLHEKLNAKLVPFAAYAMPISYPTGIVKEHLHTRSSAALFDVSHMGQIMVSGASATEQLETLLPVDLEALNIRQQSYALLMNEAGGVTDDLIITRMAADDYHLVVNAACKEKDLAYLQEHLSGLSIVVLQKQSLIALQGPKACTILSALVPGIEGLGFMQTCDAEIVGVHCQISRSGYTGEDGFEISMADSAAEKLAACLLDFEDLRCAGLGARDSLRLEAGLCLYGHELDENITPIEAGLSWSISKSRRNNGSKEGGFPGAELVLQQLQQAPLRRRAGLKIEGRIPVREGAELLDQNGKAVGRVTSGAFSPCLQQPLAMGFVDIECTEPGTVLQAMVRDKAQKLTVSKLPFVPHRYYRNTL